MSSRYFISINIGISVSGFGVIRASKCWTLASDRSGAKFERRFACTEKDFRLFRCWMDQCRCAGWMMNDGSTHFLSALRRKRPDGYCIVALYSERLASLLLAIGVRSHWLPHLIYYKRLSISHRNCTASVRSLYNKDRTNSMLWALQVSMLRVREREPENLTIQPSILRYKKLTAMASQRVAN